MIVDMYQFFLRNPAYHKLVGDDFLMVEYKCPLDVDKFQLWTETHMLTYVVSGEKDWIADGETYHIREGDALFLRKGVYTTRQYFEVDYCVMLFFISDEFISRFLKEQPDLNLPSAEKGQSPQVFPVDVDETLKALFLTVFNYFKKGGGIPTQLVDIKFKELIFNLILNRHNRRLAAFFASRNQSFGNELESIMLQNFQHDLSMEDFARLSGRSLSSFKREFKSHFNETPGKWLTLKRLEFAHDLLIGSDLDVNEICYESGFKNPSHFNKVFKENYKLPPQQYRNANARA